jgi:H+/Cl- antiporter ClcA
MAWPRALQLRRHFQRVVLARPWLTFVVLGLAFCCFGMVTLNLVHLLRANAELILDNGVMALADGGALQLVELLANGYLAMFAYVVMKTCEHALSHWLADTSAFAPSRRDDADAPSDPNKKH